MEIEVASTIKRCAILTLFLKHFSILIVLMLICAAMITPAPAHTGMLTVS